MSGGNDSWWCYSGALVFPVPISTTPTCDPGYFCPNIVANDSLTWPQICPPTTACQLQRLGSEYCSPQGKYEPSLCPPGYFCPNFTSVLPCPEGHYCLRGSTEPAPCPLLASCPPLTVRRREYGGIVLTLGLDVLMLLILMYMKFVWEPRAVNRDRGHGVMEPSVSLRDALHATGEGTDLMAHGMEAGFGSVHASPTLAQSTNDLEKALLRASDAEASLAAPIDAPHDVALPRVPSFRELGSLDTLKDGFRRCNAGLRLDVRFDDLGYTLPPPLNKTILSDVSGHIRPGRVTAVMGPSGAGKTTFMSVLMGKVNRTSGTLRINGAADEMYRYKTICGYVPQEDTMIREMTVRENILFSARMRLPRQLWTDDEIVSYVDAVIDVLGLSECANTLIGSESSRGVSGGQRKRTNIGMELAVAPAALFLDEPTSGLDSAAALEVCSTLRAIANLGLTVVAVVHQPRLEIFDSFDDLLLLAPGGYTAFIGARERAIPYFQELGYTFSAGNNPADELLDFVAGREFLPTPCTAGAPAPSVGRGEVEGLRNRQYPSSAINVARSGAYDSISSTSPAPSPTPMSASMWDRIVALGNPAAAAPSNKNEYAASAFFRDQWLARGAQYDILVPASSSTTPDIARISAARGAPFLRQLYLCHQRSVLQQYRLISTYGLEMGVCLLSGGMMGAASSRLPSLYLGILKPPYILISASPMETVLPSVGLFISLAVGLAGSPAGVLTFGEEKAVYFREAAAGHSTLAYYIGKTVSVLYRMTMGSLHFSALFMVLARPTSSFGALFLIAWMQFFCVYGLSAIVSMLVKRENAPLLAVIVSLVVATLCGYAPNLAQFAEWHLSWVIDMSYARWAVEAWFQVESEAYRRLYMVQEVSAPLFGYTLDRFGTDLAIVAAIGIGFRILAYILLITVDRTKQR